jgi:hypothetical protein
LTPPFEGDLIEAALGLELVSDTSTIFVTYGLSDRIDIGLTVPFVRVKLNATVLARLQRLSTALEPEVHAFDGPNPDEQLYSLGGTAAGLGDIVLRAKYRVPAGGLGVAAAVEARLPTGDEMNLLGTGAASLQPFVIWSATFQNVSPHLNATYKWIGSSVLAGNPATGEAEDFPDQIGYAVGAEVSVHPRLTMAFDLLGRYVIDSERLVSEDFQALDGRSVFPNIVFVHDSFNALSGAWGLKASVRDRLLVDFNLLFALDQHGLRDKVTPLVGVEYTF